MTNDGKVMSPYTVRTFKGHHLDFVEPKSEEIDIEDIALALSRAPRFNGHTTPFYSVAQHSYMVSQIAPPGKKLWGLLHDASEAYIADVPTPAKRLMPDYYRVEKVLQDKIMETFGAPIGAQADPDVVLADVAMLFLERDAMISADLNWPNEDQHPGGTMLERFPWWAPWDSETAMFQFYNRFKELENESQSVAQAA